jgi:glycosyltransferase involved in cell wall biosynthesis
VPNLRRDGWIRKFFSWDKAYLWEQVSFARNLRRHLRGDRFDIVHAADPNVAQQLIAHCRKHNLALVYQDGLSIGPAWCAKFEHVQALAPFYLEQARAAGVDTKGWRMIPHFVDTRIFAPVADKRAVRARLFKGALPADAIALLAVGDFSAQGSKRLDWILDEFAKVKGSDHLILVGNANVADLNAISGRATGVKERVHFLTNISHQEMTAVYQAADLFVHAATREPFGIVLIEAMASGLPVIGHHFEVTQWIVGDGGFVVDMTKAGELAGAIEKLLLDTKARGEIAQKAVARARAVFDKSVVLPMYHAWYQELASRQIR